MRTWGHPQLKTWIASHPDFKQSANSLGADSLVLEEIEEQEKEGNKLKYRIKHLLRNYREDEEKHSEEKAALITQLNKANYRILHLKRTLENEEANRTQK